ncbi:MAG TPA: RNA methyltransferase [Chloroflexota bacterium]|nr:RNA methyltransferase [Chloroflexota bacterium]
MGPRDAPLAPGARRLRVSTENNLFQHFEVLKRNRNKRHRSREFFVEGVKSINAARVNGWPIKTLIYDRDRALSRWALEILTTTPGVVLAEVTTPLMEKLSDKDEPSELLAVVGMRDGGFERITPRRQTLVLVLDRPASPGNLGTTIRSCAALNADGLVITGHGADLYDPHTVRGSMGALFSLPVVRAESHLDVQQWAEREARAGRPLQIAGAAPEATRTIDEVDLRRPTILVMGNETIGLSEGYRSVCDVLVRIPMYRGADSLNVASAAAIMLYEVDRQRRAAGEATT